MPYINPNQRSLLDPAIAPLVSFIKEQCHKSTEKLDYLKWLKYALFELTTQINKRFAKNSHALRSSLNPFILFQPGLKGPMTAPKPLVSALADIIKGLAEGPNFYANIAGLFNYACTQIIFNSLPEVRYWSLNAARSACTRVALALDRLLSTDDLLADLLIGILLNDIPDESYRRVVAGYEDAKIRENGDVASYKPLHY